MWFFSTTYQSQAQAFQEVSTVSSFAHEQRTVMIVKQI